MIGRSDRFVWIAAMYFGSWGYRMLSLIMDQSYLSSLVMLPTPSSFIPEDSSLPLAIID